MDPLLESLTNNNIVKIGQLSEQTIVFGKPFPLTLSPAQENVNFIQVQEFVQKNRELLLKAASEYGAVYFKGFEIVNANEWASVLYKTGLKEMEYVGGAAVRRLIIGNEQRLVNVQVFTTNESPPSEPIPFHHELAQTANPPTHICFYCRLNSAEGGSTPLLRSDFVFENLEKKYPEFVQKIEQLGVRYVRIVPEEDDPSSALGRSWKSMFWVNNRQDAEIKMQELGYSWEWYENGDCKTISKVLPAIKVSSNGKKSFFNQVIAAYTGWIDKRNDPKKAVIFGDNSELPNDILDDLSNFMNTNAMAAKWANGDFVIVDNTVTYHARQPFKGQRSVLASLGNGTKQIFEQTSQVLYNGDQMPSFGLGLWKIPNDQCPQVIEEAVRAGYRCFDSAADYGNELEVGQGLKQVFEKGLAKREDLWVTSKLWNQYHRKEHVKAACLRTLKDLGLEYLDLYLIHFPIALKYVPFEERYPPGWFHNPHDSNPQMEEDNVPISETWAAMEELVREGLVRNIGVCNFGTSLLRDLLNYAKIKPAVLQVEIHPYNSQEKLLQFCRQKGIIITAFSNLGASSYFELNMASKNDSVLEQDLIKQISKKYQKTEAQVVLRWGVQRGTSIIPKSTKPERLRENLNLFDFQLTYEEMRAISALNQNRRFNDPGDFCLSAFNTFFPIYE